MIELWLYRGQGVHARKGILYVWGAVLGLAIAFKIMPLLFYPGGLLLLQREMLSADQSHAASGFTMYFFKQGNPSG